MGSRRKRSTVDRHCQQQWSWPYASLPQQVCASVGILGTDGKRKEGVSTSGGRDCWDGIE
eukprot:2421660-Ditylum_brightwellii.AAC.1